MKVDLDKLEVTEKNGGFYGTKITPWSKGVNTMHDSGTPIPDVVNHPNHYKNSKFETIEVIEEIVKHYDDGFVSYCVGNALKYLSRAPFKHGEPTEDISKAGKYIEFAINYLNKNN